MWTSFIFTYRLFPPFISLPTKLTKTTQKVCWRNCFLSHHTIKIIKTLANSLPPQILKNHCFILWLYIDSISCGGDVDNGLEWIVCTTWSKSDGSNRDKYEEWFIPDQCVCDQGIAFKPTRNAAAFDRCQRGDTVPGLLKEVNATPVSSNKKNKSRSGIRYVRNRKGIWDLCSCYAWFSWIIGVKLNCLAVFDVRLVEYACAMYFN